MNKEHKIGHEGVIKNISAQTIEVVITNHSACSACHAKGACGMSEVKHKTIIASRPDFKVTPGDKVIVLATVNHAVYSITLAYLIPSFLLIITIFILLTIGLSEINAAISSLVLLTVYFLILYQCRKKIGDKIKFTIEKIN